MRVDVCNGDADGLCAAIQWRLHAGAPSRLVTGLKRDLSLLERVQAGPGDEVCVFDISMRRNDAALRRLLEAGAAVRYFDHHHPGHVPQHARLEAHIDTASTVCTSLLVDRHLGGAHQAWALAGAYGDNMTEVAERLAAEVGLPAETRAQLRRLGECINYNAYGETEADVYLPPARLYEVLARYPDPLQLLRQERIIDELDARRRADMQRALGAVPRAQSDEAAVYVLPDEAWSRRVVGSLANVMAQRQPQRAHAVLKAQGGGYLVSVRAPLQRPWGADGLCKCFGGGGRHGAAGIDCLPPDGLEEFVRAFMAHAWAPPPAA